MAWLCVAVITMNCCSVSTSALQKSSPHFDDVPSSYWAYDAIMEAAEAASCLDLVTEHFNRIAL